MSSGLGTPWGPPGGAGCLGYFTAPVLDTTRIYFLSYLFKLDLSIYTSYQCSAESYRYLMTLNV